MSITMQDAMDNTAMREMPRYQSHKYVWALKIKAIDKANPPTSEELQELLDSAEDTEIAIAPDGSLSVEGSNPEEEVVGAVITPEEEGYAAFPVSRAYVSKHNPQVGGYFVVYADGYKSWSPAQAFEEGYTRV
jgi:hypothetical protein